MASNDNSYEAVLARNGKPDRQSEFAIGDIRGEFRVELYNHYPNDAGQNADIRIREATWLQGEKNLTVWFHKKGGIWVELHSMTWDKDSEF